MMHLYHGTAAKHLESIKERGILPRRMLRGKVGRGNWQHTVTSNRKAVYLTDSYAAHFAAHAGADRKRSRGLILEISRDALPPWKLCPDEDFMEQATRGKTGGHYAPVDASMKQRTLHYRKIAEFNAPLVDQSLEAMGTAAFYGVIPWSSVTRYVLIDWSKLPMGMYLRACDTMVSIMNYVVLADRHRALTRWFFGDHVTVEDFLGFAFADNPHMREVDFIKKQIAAIEQEIPQRDGLQVFNTKPKQEIAA